jgi:hypothetical protein
MEAYISNTRIRLTPKVASESISKLFLFWLQLCDKHITTLNLDATSRSNDAFCSSSRSVQRDVEGITSVVREDSAKRGGLTNAVARSEQNT